MNSLDELILKWQEGSLGAEELRQLNLLLARPENRAVLREEFLLTAGLAAASRSPESKIVPMGAEEPVRPGVRWVAALAACLALGLLIFAFRPDQPVSFAAERTISSGDVEELLNLDAGATVLRLQPNSLLQVVSLTGQKQFRLERGSLRAQVAPQREPMRIFTSQAEAVILGTEFVLSALSNSTRLDVSEGLVRFKRVADGSALDVSARQFAAVSPGLRFAPASLPPAPWHDRPIGDVAMHGAAFVEGGKCLLKGAGRNTCLQKDQLQFLYQAIEGDFELRARLISFDGKAANARAGIMVRRSLQTACRQAFLSYRGDGQLEIQCRPETESQELFTAPVTLPVTLRITRSGPDLRFAISENDVEWREIGQEKVDFGNAVFAGLAVTSFNSEVMNESLFEDFSLSLGN